MKMNRKTKESDRIRDISGTESFFTVKLRYFGSIRAAAETPEALLKVPSGTTPVQLLHIVCNHNTTELRDEILEKGSDTVRTDLMITLNGTILSSTELVTKVLESEDVISIFPIFPGGG